VRDTVSGADGTDVSWKFVSVHKVEPVIPGGPRDGEEVFTLFLEEEIAESIVDRNEK
jgi:hypothetical protein